MNQLSHFVQSLPSNAPKTARGQKTWIAILQAAEHEFGEKGYHEAAITSITQKVATYGRRWGCLILSRFSSLEGLFGSVSLPDHNHKYEMLVVKGLMLIPQRKKENVGVVSSVYY